jgi:tartrate dehydratase alpha subunit/fumarate hydratase class I-like protein
LLELILLAATDLPPDVEASLVAPREREASGSAAQGALDTILKNVAMARATGTPICQDTGTPIFYVKYPEGWSTRKLREQIRAAAADARTWVHNTLFPTQLLRRGGTWRACAMSCWTRCTRPKAKAARRGSWE